MSKVSLSLQGKLLCVASDKIQALNKNQILKNLHYHCDFDGYLILKAFSDDIDGDINKCYFFFNNSLFFKLINLFLTVLGLRFCARAFSSCGERGPLFIAVRGPFTVAASSCGAQAPDAQAQ